MDTKIIKTEYDKHDMGGKNRTLGLWKTSFLCYLGHRRVTYQLCIADFRKKNEPRFEKKAMGDGL